MTKVEYQRPPVKVALMGMDFRAGHKRKIGRDQTKLFRDGFKGGMRADTVYVKVPMGTLVRDDATGAVMADLVEDLAADAASLFSPHQKLQKIETGTFPVSLSRLPISI